MPEFRRNSWKRLWRRLGLGLVWRYLAWCAAEFRLLKWMFGWMGRRIYRGRSIGSSSILILLIIPTTSIATIMRIHIPILVRSGQDYPHTSTSHTSTFVARLRFGRLF